jgi:T-complex protein 1 subunit gamma
VGTKFVHRFGNLVVDLAIDAVLTVSVEVDGKKEIDVKRYAKVEKIPGGEVEDSRVLKGVMFNKDITHPKMRRKIKDPRVILLDCTLEYKKGESQTNVEISNEGDWEALLKAEEDWVKATVSFFYFFAPVFLDNLHGLGGSFQANSVSLFFAICWNACMAQRS